MFVPTLPAHSTVPTFEQAVWLVPAAIALGGLGSSRLPILILAACAPLFGSPPGGPYLEALTVAGLVTILASRWRSVPGSRLNTVDIAVLAILAVSLASMLPTSYHPPSWGPGALTRLVRTLPGVQSWSTLYTWRALLNLALGLGLYATARRVFAGQPLRPVGIALAWGLTVATGLGLLEHTGLIDLNGYRAIGHYHYETRLHSLFFHAGWLAEYLVITAPLAIGAAVSGGRWSRLAGLVLTATTLLTLLLTEARGGWVAALSQLLAVGLLLGPRVLTVRRTRAQLVAVAATAVALGGIAVLLRPSMLAPVTTRLQTVDLAGRPALWRTATEMTAERPGLGWGLGSFAPVYDLRKPPGTEGAVWTRATPHSLYFAFAAERGLLGLLALTVLGCAVAVRLTHGIRAATDAERPMLIALAVSVVGLAVYGLVQYMLYLQVMEYLCWLLVGLAASLPATSSAGLDRATRRAAMVCGLIACVAGASRAVLGVPLVTPSDRSFGLHEAEMSSVGFRWTDRFAALQVPRGGRTLRLSFANGHPAAHRHPVTVQVTIDGHRHEPFVVRGGWEEHPFALAVDGERPDQVLIEVEARPTFRPFQAVRPLPELPPSGDIRRLGVAMADPAWSD